MSNRPLRTQRPKEPRTIRASSFPEPLAPAPSKKQPVPQPAPVAKPPRKRQSPRQRSWTAEEDQFLRRNYPRHGAQYCAEKLERTRANVGYRAEILGIRSNRNRPWTHREEALLRMQYQKLTAPQLAQKLKRTGPSVRQRLKYLGLTDTSNRPWDTEELAFLWAHYDTMSSAEIAEELGRTVAAVEVKAGRIGRSTKKTVVTEKQEKIIVARMGGTPYTTIARELGLSTEAVTRVARKHGHRVRSAPRSWTDEEDAVLRELFPTMNNQEIAEQLGRTPIAVNVRCRALGLLRQPGGGSAGPRKTWTDEEDAQLKRLCPKMPYKQVAKALGRTEISVAARARMLGIRRPPRGT